MSDRTYRISLLVGAGLLFLGVFGYSVFSYTGNPLRDREADRASERRVRAPMVMFYSSGVRPYSRRSVRSAGQRGGGIRGGK